MKRCIWCLKHDKEVLFNKLAHTIPQSLGGKSICNNVCDSCNSFFGNYSYGLPPIETMIKEAFNVTRARILSASKEVGRNSELARFKSTFFNVNFEKRTVTIKGPKAFKAGYSEDICRQFRKGLFKIYLEENERQLGVGHNTSFNFIREFARFNIGDYPVFYFYRSFAAIADIGFRNPELFLDEKYQMAYLVREPGFFEFELFGHVFGIPTVRNWEITRNQYIDKSIFAKQGHFKGWKSIRHFNDIDLTLSLFNS